MPFLYNDGGRAAAGFKGQTGDCVVRAIAIAAEMDYREVYDLVNLAARDEPADEARRSSARIGVRKPTSRRIMDGLGWRWTPMMSVGSGCRVHLRADELPGGRLVAAVSKHLCAVVDGVLHDTHDSSRDGTRCVYGYWAPPGSPVMVNPLWRRR